MRLLRLALIAGLSGLLFGCDGGGSAPDVVASASPTAPATAPTAAASPTERTEGSDRVDRLRQGGYVIYIRHAKTESAQDDPTIDLSDPGTQRNLSADGRAQAREIGQAVRRLGIPIGQVLVSPYDRTRETGELAFGKERVRATRDLISEGYPGTDDDALARSLRGLLRQRPTDGTNTVLVSHGFNLGGATGQSAAEGEALIFDPAARDPLEPIARIGADEWRTLTG